VTTSENVAEKEELEMANPLTGIFGAGPRKALYTTYSLIGLVVGGIQAAYGSVSAGSPNWLKVTLSVYAFLGTAIGATAASNVISKAGPVPTPDGQ
jgi:hypothetical protein